MASEIRVNKINSRTGVGTITLSPTGVDFTGITTAATLRATTGIVTSLTAGSLTSLGAVSGTTATFSSTTTVEGALTLVDTIVHSGDDNTKIRFPAADTVTVETGGTEALRVDSSQKLLIGTTSSQGHASGNLLEIGNYTLTNAGITINNPTNGAGLILFGDSSSTNRRGRIEYNHTADAFRFYTADSERVRIDSSGNFGVGTDSPNAGLNVGLGGNTIPTAGASTGSALFGNATGGNAYGLVVGATSGGVGYISAQRADGTATTYNLALQPNGGNIGIGTASPSSLLHLNANATALRITRGSSIGFLYNSGANSTDPTRLQAEYGPLELYTNSAQPVKVRVNGTEEARFLSGGGLTFNGDTATANALDDYEEGTWTPTLNTGTAVTQTGVYIKIGSFVWLKGQVKYTITNTGSEYLRLGGLPFAIASDADNRGYQVMYVEGRSQTHAWETYDGTGNLALSTGGTTFLGDRSTFSGKNFQFNFFYPTHAL